MQSLEREGHWEAETPQQNPALDAYSLIVLASQKTRNRCSPRDFLVIELMATYILIACDPVRFVRICYDAADSIISSAQG